MRHLALVGLLALLPALSACGDFFGDDGDVEGDPFVLANDQGSVQALAGGDVSAALLWEGEIAPSATAVMVSDGDSLYVGSATQVVAFSQSTGAQQWAAPASLTGDAVALAGPGSGAVFAMTLDGSLSAINLLDGSISWTLDLLVDLPGSSDDALFFSEGVLFLGGDPIRALSPTDGSLLASYSTGDSYVSDLAVVGGAVFAGLADRVVALSSSSLEELWSHPTSDEVDNLVAGGGSVFFSVVGGGVHLLTDSGNPVASAGGDSVFQALARSSRNLLLAARSDATLFAWDEVALEEQWSLTEADTPVQGLVASGSSVFYGNAGYVDGISASDGSSLWYYQAGVPAGLLGL